MRKHQGTDGSLLASLPWTLAALGFSVLPHVAYLPLWISVSLVACATARWHIERRRWRLPPAWLRIVVALLSFAGVYVSYESVSGVGPGSSLLVIMAALKLMETAQRRDQYVILFISLFLIMSSLLREQYLWSLPFLIAAMLLVMTAWLRVATAMAVSPRQTIGTAARLVVYAVPLTLALWVFFPRIATPFWAVPIDSGSGVTGLDDRMSPGDVSTLSQSNAVAFRVAFDGDVPPPELRYWRSLVLHGFNGRTWSGSEPTPDFRAHDEIQVEGEAVHYQVTIEPTRQQWIPALDIPWQWSLDDTFMGPQHQLSRIRPLDQRVIYNAVSYPRYRSNLTLSRAAASWYTRLPDSGNPRTVEMARQMRSAVATHAAFIDAVLRMFHEQEYFYTLQPPRLGSDPVDRFLFGTRRGFCEHYASAFAVMMRAAGIPARIVLGYQGGEMNRFGRYMIVRQSDAHAWTEVWLAGRGWLRVDPTAAVAPERIESGMSGARFGEIGASWGLSAPAEWLYELQLSWDALNAQWNAWVLGYGPENQELLMQWFGMEQPDWRKMMLVLVALATLIMAVVSVLLLRRNRPPKPDEALRLFRQFARQAGFMPDLGETPQTFALRIEAAGAAPPGVAQQVIRTYLVARYGPDDPRAIDALRSAIEMFKPGEARRRASTT